MKIRLQVTTSPDKSFALEHATPLIRIGRDPRSEIAIVGASSQGVSWEHARIEITSRGAVLHDLGSTNGTQLNGHRIRHAARVRVGDQIQLGQGPRLQVLELDTIGAPGEPEGLAAVPASTGSWLTPGREHVLVLGAVIGVFCAIAAGTAALLVEPPPNPEPPYVSDNTDRPEDKTPPDTKPPDTKPPDTKPPDTKPPDTKPPDTKPPDTKPPDTKPPDVKPAEGRRPVGKFVAAQKAPSILLQREDNKSPWKGVQPQGRVHTGDLLVSLPGYRSELLLDSGVQLLLWGNVPEQLNLPLLESAIVLHNPEPGVDLSFTLDRGRVLVGNKKPDGSARVQVRFADESWELTLSDSDSEVGLDLVGRQGGTGTGEGPLAFLQLEVLKGQVQLQSGVQQFALKTPGPASFLWSNRGSAPPGPRPLEEVSPWWRKTLPATWQWEKFPAREQENARQAYDTMRQALDELSSQLAKEKASLNIVLAEDQQSTKPMLRALAVLTLGAIDALPELLDAVADEKFVDVREAAVTALRHWLGRRDGQDKVLRKALTEKRYTAEQIDTIMQLLPMLSAEDRAKKETYQVLIDYLIHEKPAVRQLAFWHLVRLVPEARKIPYDPGAGMQQRKAGYEQWRKLLAEGKLPPKLPSPPTPKP